MKHSGKLLHPQSSNSILFISLILLVLLLVLTTVNDRFMKFNSYITYSDSKKQNDTLARQKTDVYVDELTGWFYIGAGRYQLVYKYDNSLTKAEYILVSATEDQFPSVVLKSEEFNAASIDHVSLSPDNTKMIVSSHIGDSAQKMLLGVNLSSDHRSIKPIEPTVLDFNESYWEHSDIVGWLDNERIIARTTDYSGDNDIMYYWEAELSNLHERTVLDFN